VLAHWLVLTLALLTGCASIPRQAFNRGTHGNVRNIALLRVHEPEQLTVSNIGSMYGAFGLLGAAMQADDEAGKRDDLTERMRAHRVALGVELSTVLEHELRKHGYIVNVWTTESPRVHQDGDDEYAPPQYSKIRDYPRIRSTADAILDVWFSDAGFTALGKDYQPWIRANARLVSTRDQSQLYFQAYSYGVDIRAEAVKHFPSQPKYAYGNFPTLMARSQEAADGLRAGVPLMARGIAADLRR
jgi:hypothetical protein